MRAATEIPTPCPGWGRAVRVGVGVVNVTSKPLLRESI